MRGRKIAQVREQQLGPALAMRPDLASVFAGTNDILRRRVSLDEVAGHMETIQSKLVTAGATVITFTMPDLSESMPIARLVRGRVNAYNEAMRAIASRTGALMIDMAADAGSGDPRGWSVDRLHASALGHQRIAAAAAELLGVDLPENERLRPFPPLADRPHHRVIAAEAEWIRKHLIPWLGRRLTGRSSGDGVLPKRPQLAPVEI